MRTRVYSETTRLGRKAWWWQDIDNKKNCHGPFPSRDEARDAAGAARITAKAKEEGRTINENILNAG